MSDTLHTKITNVIAKHGQVTKPMVDEIVRLVHQRTLDATNRTIMGYCPNCGSSGMFVGEGGYLTCSYSFCDRPEAPSEMLGVKFKEEETQE